MTRERKHSIVIAGHRTSVSLEGPFWDALKRIAQEQDSTMAALVAQVDQQRGAINLSSALRLRVLAHYQERAGEIDTKTLLRHDLTPQS